MSRKAQSSLLLESDAWQQGFGANLIRASDRWDRTPEYRSHGHVLRRFFEDIDVDAVLCVDGRPSVAVKDARNLSAIELEELRHRLWNLSAVTILLAECAHEIKVFSTFVKPSSNDRSGQNSQLTAETIIVLTAAELALRLKAFIHRVESGAIYRDYKSLFSSDDAVDYNLLRNLKEARDRLCPTKTLKGYRRAHALIGRFLFCCYLLDRGIIGSSYLGKANLPEADDMVGLVVDDIRGPINLGKLFDVLQRDFNGSLFGDLLDDRAVSTAEVKVMLDFLGGDISTGQLSLFRLYDFRFIPVELISSVYEEFLGAESALEDVGSQRSQGAYYTPPRLAELAVDIATEGWETLLDKKCLDPACGSGVFLVILFIRMAEEWRSRHPRADTKERYEQLLKLLSENLRGIDIHPTACLVTCFSLYLAFLDQMKPREINELREALDRDKRAKILPKLLWRENEARPRAPHLATVRSIDFFKLPANEKFDLVLGNPPWISRKDAPAAETWLFSADNPYYPHGGSKNITSQMLFPTKEIASAFMWKAGLHASQKGRVCQVLPSRVFLSNNTDRFQSAWLKHYCLEAVWLLADWSFILFPNADCPCFIARYHAKTDTVPPKTFDYVTPKVGVFDPREALISVYPEDQKSLSQEDVIEAAAKNEAAAFWKQHFWGTERDVRFLKRLARMPRLNRLTTAPSRSPHSASNKDSLWFKGQGFQPATKSTTNAQPAFWKSSDLFLSATAPVFDLILLPNQCERIGAKYKTEGLHRKRDSRIYKAPLLLINKACKKFLFSDFDVLFQDDFQSITAPKKDEDALLFLTAVLSSPLTQYLLFHSTANIGVERDVARLKEILELPFPLPEDTANPTRSRAILKKSAQRLRALRRELQKSSNLLATDSLVEQAHKDLFDFICEYFEICEWERKLIEDTVNIFRPSSTPASLDSSNLHTAKDSTPANRKEYSSRLLNTFRAWTKTKDKLWVSSSLAPSIGVAVVTLGISPTAEPYSENQMDRTVSKLLDDIRSHTSKKGVLFSRLKGFALYESDRVHIVKPLARRHWTNTSALNDADEIVGRMMEDSGWGA